MHAVKRAIKADQLSCRTMVHSHVLRQKTYSTPRCRMTEGMPKHLAATAAGKGKTQGNVNGSSLAGAVGTEESEYFATLNAQRKSVQRLDRVVSEKAAVFLGNVVELECRSSGHGDIVISIQ